ncbi:dUTP diphosphatase [Fructilactobacillus myrtifloralis]|uniref:dUTP diphosphatase n=1 Tax=Fructilactobacillus myrtifloralis TaxID=2940301 RepID=A0ABY5BMU4_9LACO|nr:dUTP diphosphatase [Fructilactobacillus myrtifloralis]USS84905.1 dUTP diphosphatase [Fructilactobacillus myrtifloralis]
MKRGFEFVTSAAQAGLKLPQRATKQAAGYDLASSQTVVLPSVWKLGLLRALKLIRKGRQLTTAESAAASADLQPYLVPTGIKAYMQPNEVLIIANRSSNPLKRNLILPNGIGVIDADYYNNANNEGEIFVQLINWGIGDRTIHKGDRIAQGIFMPYLLADQEAAPTATRTGGFGSSGD